MRLTRIHQVAARRGDAADARHFYQDQLGARLLAQFEPPGLLFFDFGGVRLLLEEDASLATLYFRVDDIHTAHRELTARGVAFDSDPHLIHTDIEGIFDTPGNAEWMAFFKDPAGNTLALASRTLAVE